MYKMRNPECIMQSHIEHIHKTEVDKMLQKKNPKNKKKLSQLAT